MASIYLDLRKEANKRNEHSIRLIIIVDRKVSKKNTGYAVEEKYWDGAKQRIKSNHKNAFEWNAALEDKLTDARRIHAQIDIAGKKITAEKIATASAVGDKFKSIAYHYASKYEGEGKIGNADRYRSIGNMVDKFSPGISAFDMDEDWLEDYQRDMRMRGNAQNTIIGHARCMSAILNKAVANSFISQNRIKEAKKGTYKKSDKQALTKLEVETLYSFIPKVRWEKTARLTFLFSFYGAGARFQDVLLMPKHAIYYEDGKARLRYKPSKTLESTNETVDILIPAKLMEMIEAARNDSGTIFGLINPSLAPRELNREVEKTQALINRALKTLMLKVGIAKSISFHCARHSFIRVAKDMKFSLEDIQTTVGHESQKTTEQYTRKNSKVGDNMVTVVSE